MSNIYIKEPPTCGKVLFHTSMGDIDVELWSKEAPIACRNFVQLCMEGYYDKVIFHRIVANFIVQGGDPTGTGEGGESIYGKPFKDEFHSRLRFVRRGLVAMANAGPNDNGSQFFFTLNTCMDLNKKHTIFGKVTGDTVYNLVRLGEVGTDDNERPINPPFIKWTKVLANPFDDIEPRVEPEKQEQEEKKKKKSQMKATKDFKLLSFGEEAEEEENDTKLFDARHASASKSSHDLANDPSLSSVPVIPQNEENKRNSKRKIDANDNDGDVITSDNADNERLQNVKDKLQMKSDKRGKKIKQDVEGTENKSDSISEELRKESRKLAREIIKARKVKTEEKSSSSSDESDDDGVSNSNPLFAEYKQQQKVYREKTSQDKKGSSREQNTLSMLESFKTKLHSVRDDAHFDENEDMDEPLDGDDDDSGWLLHRLKREEILREAKDVNRDVNEDRYDLSDPRNPLNKRRREESKKNRKDKRHHSDRHRRR